ncbi:MAG: response regulator [Algoriphagus sp.]|nr:response regulator [Algoriphagus sp.]
MKRHVILVVDDEMEIRAFFTRYLKKKGFEVQTAGNLADGRILLNDIKPTLIFLDINLPDGNGLDELEELKKGKLSENVIMMSANDNKEVIERAEGLGAFDFLSKPFNLTRLEQVIESHLNHTN